MLVKTNWLQEQYIKVKEESRKSTRSIDEVIDELGYSEREKSLLRWVFTD